MPSKIYTKTGDAGKTSLIGGTKVFKNDARIEAYGAIDELNSYMGLVKDVFTHPHTHAILKDIQNRLFTIGSLLACDYGKKMKIPLPDIKEDDIILLEKEIDAMNEQLPEVKNFILPGGHPAVSHTHIARCVCRRAERCCVNMQQHKLFVDGLIIKYLNRLSDYLFVLARFITHNLNVEEIIWQGKK